MLRRRGILHAGAGTFSGLWYTRCIKVATPAYAAAVVLSPACAWGGRYVCRGGWPGAEVACRGDWLCSNACVAYKHAVIHAASGEGGCCVYLAMCNKLAT